MRSQARRFALAAAWLALACSDPAPQPTPAPEAAAAAEEPAPRTAAPSAAADTAAAAPEAARGKTLFENYCVSCHGPHGDGDGPVAKVLDPKPARLGDRATMSGKQDDYLFQVIKGGGASVGRSPLMAPWGGSLSDAQIRDLIAFIRTLAH